jgi:peptide chain release factor 1
VHTSTVTVAVMDDVAVKAIEFNDKDFRIEWYSGTGCGGQNRNKVKSSCRLTHIPTGIVQTSQTRSRENSYALAREAIEKEVTKQSHGNTQQAVSLDRKQQVGSGMRGDKIRTYREQDGIVTDHRSNMKVSLKLIEQGRLELLR